MASNGAEQNGGDTRDWDYNTQLLNLLYLNKLNSQMQEIFKYVYTNIRTQKTVSTYKYIM